jgi:alkylation response protein AidB-like acyl-CoA dehydrogenase
VVLAVHSDADGVETDPVPLVAVDVDTGARTQLSGIPTSGNYAVSRLQVPHAALVGSVGHAGPPASTRWDHGRGDLALRLAGVAALAAGVALTVAAAVAVGRSAGARLRHHRTDRGAGTA